MSQEIKHLFIINPAAGKGNSTEILLDKIKALKLKTEIVLTAGPGDAERLSRQAAERGEPMRIYACGGDGTLNEVVNGTAGFEHIAITNYPKGTGNDFLRIFGPERYEGFTDLDRLSRGPQKPFDVIDCNGRLGINIVCVGIDAQIAADVHQYTQVPLLSGTGAYVVSLIANLLLRKLGRRAVVDIGNFHYDGEITLLCACNGRYYGGGFMPVREAMPDNGGIDFLMVPKVSKLTFGRLVGEYSKGNYMKYPQYIRHWFGDKITLRSPEELTAVTDGEAMRSKNYAIRLSEKKVNFFWPEGLDYQVR